MNKLIKIFFTLLMISSCEVTKQKRMDKNDPEYKKYLEQEHRFEFNKCKLKYNGKPFYIGMSLDKLKEVFGDDFFIEKNINNYKKEPYFVFYKEEGVVALLEKGYLRDIYIYIQDKRKREKYDIKGNKSIIFNNTILNQDDRMQDFLKKSDLNFEDFEIDGWGYLQRYTCEKDTLIYDLESPLAYHRIGGGHLYVRGDWKLDDTHPINYFHFYINNDPPSEFQ